MALKMFDASAKLPPAGMLTSFITQHPGTFDSCLEVQSEELTGDMLRRRETVNFSSITKPLLLKEQTHWKRRVLPLAANRYIPPHDRPALPADHLLPGWARPHDRQGGRACWHRGHRPETSPAAGHGLQDAAAAPQTSDKRGGSFSFPAALIL